MKSSFVRSVTSLYIVQAATYIFPLLSFPYLLRTLGISVFGQTQIAIAFAGLGAILTDWGFGYSATHQIARAQGDKRKISEIASNTICAKLVLFLLWLAVGFAILPLNSKLQMSPLYYMLAMANVLTGALIPTWLYQGLERFSEMSYTSLVTRAIATVAIFAAVHSQTDGPAVLIIAALNNLLIAAYLWLRAVRTHSLTLAAPGLLAIWATIRDSSQIFLTTGIISTYTTGAVLIVGALGGVEAAGAYAAVDRILTILKSLLTPVVQVIYARVSAVADITRAAFLRETARPMLLLSGGMLVLALVLICSGRFLFGVIFKLPYTREIGVLIPLAFVLPVVSLVQWFVPVGLLARGQRHYWTIVIVSGPIAGLFVGIVARHVLVPASLIATAVLAIEVTMLAVGIWCWNRSWSTAA